VALRLAHCTREKPAPFPRSVCHSTSAADPEKTGIQCYGVRASSLVLKTRPWRPLVREWIGSQTPNTGVAHIGSQADTPIAVQGHENRPSWNAFFVRTSTRNVMKRYFQSHVIVDDRTNGLFSEYYGVRCILAAIFVLSDWIAAIGGSYYCSRKG